MSIIVWLEFVVSEMAFKQIFKNILDHFTKHGGLKFFKEVFMGKQEMLDKILNELTRIEGSEGAAIVGIDGMVIASKLDKKFAQDKMAALISHTVMTANKVLTEAALGKPDSVIIEGTDGKVVLMASEKAKVFIFVIGTKDMNLGMARIILDDAIEDFDDAIK